MDNNAKKLLFNLLKEYKKNKYKIFQAEKAILVRNEYIIIPHKYEVKLIAHENGIQDNKFRMQVTLSVLLEEQKFFKDFKKKFINKILDRYLDNTDLSEDKDFINGNLHFTIWDNDYEDAIKYLNNVFDELIGGQNKL